MFGLPVDVLHTYLGQTATMRVKACSLIPMVNAAGAEMDRAGTVTMFNDICVLAPAAPIDAPITWQPIDDRRVRGAFTNGAHSVTADLAFDDNHELVDFTSDDRLRASPDGKTFTPQRWSTPINDYRSFGSRRVAPPGKHVGTPPTRRGSSAISSSSSTTSPTNAGTAATSSTRKESASAPPLPAPPPRPDHGRRPVTKPSSGRVGPP